VKKKLNVFCQILLDAIYCILFFTLGIFFTINYLLLHYGLHHREWCIADFTIAVLLAVPVIWRNYWCTKLIAVQKKTIDILNVQLQSLKEESTKLKNIAFAATAVETTIEHGMRPNIEPLKHFLEALRPTENSDSDEENETKDANIRS